MSHRHNDKTLPANKSIRHLYNPEYWYGYPPFVFKEEVTVKQQIQQCGRWLHDPLAPLAGRDFLWDWRQFEREWARVAGEKSEKGAAAHA